MPLAATKSKYGKNLEVLHSDPAPPQGHAMSVKCEEPIDELTVQVSLPYHQAKKKKTRGPGALSPGTGVSLQSCTVFLKNS